MTRRAKEPSSKQAGLVDTERTRAWWQAFAESVRSCDPAPQPSHRGKSSHVAAGEGGCGAVHYALMFGEGQRNE